jgi:2-octaprenyl-6-methoxyphenol hydroxylase
MQSHGAELRKMRIVDAGGAERAPRDTVDFDGAETGAGAFGWNIPNIAARAALLDAIARLPNVRIRPETRVTGYVTRTDHAMLRTDAGDQIQTRLVVAADGRDSTLRRLAGIRHKRWEYGQRGLVFVVTHPNPHQGISTEIHRTGGPLTLVPMPDLDGKPCSSVVWMVPGPRAQDLAAMDDSALGAEITAETMDLFGDLTVAGPRATWPIISQIAVELKADRLALIAEAAHVMPPIGAQGLNTSLHDVETLATLVAQAPDPGAPDLLRRYEQQILPRTMLRVGGIDLLNRAAMTEFQPLRDLRRVGLNAIGNIAPLRRLAIRTGMGG